MPDNDEIQLLHDSGQVKKVKHRGSNKALIYALVFLFLVLGIYAGLFTYKNNIEEEIQNIDVQIASIESARDPELEKEILDFHKQLKSVRTLLAQHVEWSDALDDLGRHIEPRVRLSNFSASLSTHMMSFSAVTDSFQNVAKQVARFYENERIESVLVNNIASSDDGRVTFEVQIEFNPIDIILSSDEESL